MSPISITTPSLRQPDPKSVLTGHSSEYERRASIQSTTALPSPSLVAARAYYLETTPPIGQDLDALRRRRSLFAAQEQSPRRHSVLAPSSDLASQVANLRVSPFSQGEKHTALSASTAVKTDDRDDIPMAGIKESDVLTASAVAERQETIAEIFRQTPFQFTHDRLREWGYAYVGNIATADALINAVSLRRPSLALVKEENLGESKLVMVRARVLPKEKERKPLLIQKQFDIEELRAGIPILQRTRGTSPVHVRRSSRTCRSSTRQEVGDIARRGSTESQSGSNSLDNVSIPIRK